MTSNCDNYNNNSSKLFPRYLLIMSENIELSKILANVTMATCGEGFSFQFPKTHRFSNF